MSSPVVVLINDMHSVNHVYFNASKTTAVMPTSMADITGKMTKMVNDNRYYGLSDPTAKYLSVGATVSSSLSGTVFDFQKLILTYAQDTSNGGQNLRIRICDSYDEANSQFVLGKYSTSTTDTTTYAALGSTQSPVDLYVVLPKYTTIPVATAAFGITIKSTDGAMYIGQAGSDGKLVLMTPPSDLIVFPTQNVNWAIIVVMLIIFCGIILSAVITAVFVYKDKRT
jgi:hypothetical protein